MENGGRVTEGPKFAGQHFVLVGAYPESLLNFRGHLIRTLVQLGHRVTAMSAPASNDVVARVEALGARFRAFPVQRNAVSVVHDLTTLVALRGAFRELQPDVILAYTIKPVIWGGLAAAGGSRAQFYALITGLGYALEGTGIRRRSLAWFVTLLIRFALRRASGVIFQNEEDREMFVSRRLVSRGLTHRVGGSGVDCERFALRPLPHGPPTFLIVARLLRAKGLREFALAARMVKQKHPDAVFRIVGGADPSPDRIDVAEVEAWEREDIVEYDGAMSDVRPALEKCHVFVLPSYYEGLPRSVLEAMATGRPILTTDVPGCRDTVIPGENGFLVPKGDAAALAGRINWFLAHQDQWPRMGAASRRIVEARFDVRHVNTQMIQIIGMQAR